MKPLIVLVLLLWLARPVAASWDLKPYAVLLAGQGADVVTTLHQNPARPCVEHNPRLGGPHATTASVLVPKLVLMGGIAALVHFAETRESNAAKVIAKSVAYAGGIVGAKAGIHNLQTCGW